MAIPASPLLLTIFSLAVLIVRLSAATVPSIFIFGDSTADVGTNNYLPYSKSKVNFMPYGVDFFPASPTGRYSNGFNAIDFLAQMMGFPRSPPPYLSLNGYGPDARNGTNFASGGSGILDRTGSIFGQYVSMGKQIQQFETVRSNITAQIGASAAEKLLADSIFLISVGSNDLFEAYAATNGSLDHTQGSFLIDTLATTYQGHLTNLYNLGARKLAVVSVPPIGCCPSQRRLHPSNGCLDGLNELALQYFHATDSMLRGLSSQLPGFKYAHGNAYQMVVEFYGHPAALGFKELKSACCGADKFHGGMVCLPSSTYCSNRDEYLFWDLYHPSQAAYSLAAEALFGGSTKFVTPINISQLMDS